MKINKKAFTLVELLVVVLIIGILAAIAVPQYQKSVYKARLSQGIPLVDSLYQAQQAYALTHGDFTTDIDALDIYFPKNSSCKQTKSKEAYDCDFGRIGIFGNCNIQFQPAGNANAYLRMYQDRDKYSQKAGERWCYAKTLNETAKSTCENMGGIYMNSGGNWSRYRLP